MKDDLTMKNIIHTIAKFNRNLIKKNVVFPFFTFSSFFAFFNPVTSYQLREYRILGYFETNTGNEGD